MEATAEEVQIVKYAAYKDSGVEWLGEIPAHWKAVSLGSLLELKSDKNHPDYEVLSVYREYGVILKDSRDDNHNVTSLDTTNYKAVEPGDLVVNKMKAWQGSMGISAHRGIVSPAYITCKVSSKEVYSEYLHQLLRSNSYIGEYNRISYGVRVGQWDMHYEDFKKVITLVPPKEEQTAIAQFLDRKTTQIDKAICINEKQIELLKERRQVLIHNAVTRGLNPSAPLKDSGVEWIGDIPAHWEVKRAKYLFDEIDDRSQTGNEELLSVSHMTGVTPRSEKNITMFMAEDYSGSKLCRENDLVYNIMWAWMGALGVSDRIGIVSPSYAIYRQKNPGTFNPWFLEHLLRDVNYVAHYNRVSTGLHSSRLRFYSNMFFAMEIGFPPREEQDEIVAYLMEASAKIFSVITTREKEIEKLKEYKASLINSAVTGKIKVN